MNVSESTKTRRDEDIYFTKIYEIIQKSALFGRIVGLEIIENHIRHFIVKNVLKSFIKFTLRRV